MNIRNCRICLDNYDMDELITMWETKYKRPVDVCPQCADSDKPLEYGFEPYPHGGNA